MDITWYGFFATYQNLINDYEMLNGKMINEAGSGYNSAGPHINREPSLGFTKKVPNGKYINPNGSEFKETDHLPEKLFAKKNMDISKLPFVRIKTPITEQNIILLRFADMLLIIAEVKMK